jgi:hypothetical protein
MRFRWPRRNLVPKESFVKSFLPSESRDTCSHQGLQLQLQLRLFSRESAITILLSLPTDQTLKDRISYYGLLFSNILTPNQISSLPIFPSHVKLDRRTACGKSWTLIDNRERYEVRNSLSWSAPRYLVCVVNNLNRRDQRQRQPI